MRKKIISIFIIIAVVAGTGVAIFKIKQLKKAKPVIQEKVSVGVPVESYLVKLDNIKVKYNYTGTVKYEDKIKISPQIMGMVKEIFVEEGEKIKKDQLLARLDDRELRTALKEAQNKIMESKNRISSSQIGIKEAELGIKKAEVSLSDARNNLNEVEASINEAKADFDHWKSEYDRDKRLFEKNAIAEAKYDQTKTQFDKARARLERLKTSKESVQDKIELARLEIDHMQMKYKAAKNELKQAKIQFKLAKNREDRAETQLSYTKLYAPIDGVVLDEMVEAGEIVGTTQPLFNIAATEPIEVHSSVGSKDLSFLNEGTPAQIEFDSLPGRVYETKINEISTMTDPNSHTTVVKFVLSNQNGMLRDGMFASVKIIPQSRNNVLSVPREAIFTYKGKPHVYVITAGKAERKTVKTGLSDGDFIEIKEGLKKGEKIAISNLNDLRDGVKVYLDGQMDGGIR